MEITPAGRLQRAQLELASTLDSVIVAARYWRGRPADPDRRRKFLQTANRAEQRAITLDTLTNPSNGDGQ